MLEAFKQWEHIFERLAKIEEQIQSLTTEVQTINYELSPEAREEQDYLERKLGHDIYNHIVSLIENKV